MKRILVTGSNKGIGLAIVEAVLQTTEHHAILCSRELSRGEEARQGLLAKNPSWVSRLEVLKLDVTSDASVQAAAAEVGAKGGLYAIVNNAGILSGTPDEVIDTNVYGVKRVVDCFLPLLDPVYGRIVNMGSGAGPNFLEKCSPDKVTAITSSDIHFQTIQGLIKDFLSILQAGGLDALETAGYGQGDGTFQPYGFSKAMVSAYTLALAREHPGLRINSCSPGMISTELFTTYAAEKGQTSAQLAAAWGGLPPSEGTKSTMHLLFADSVRSGHYYGSDAKRSPMSKYRSPGSPEYDGSLGN